MTDEGMLYLSTSQVARRIGLSAERVRQLSRTAALKPDLETTSGRFWLPSTVEAYLARRYPITEPPEGDIDGCQG